MQFPAKVRQGKFEAVLTKDCMTFWYDGILACDLPADRIKEDPQMAIAGFRLIFEMIENSVVKEKEPLEFINKKGAVN